MTPHLGAAEAAKATAKASLGAGVINSQLMRVVLRTTNKVHEAWRLEMEVPRSLRVKELRKKLERAPYGLKLSTHGFGIQQYPDGFGNMVLMKLTDNDPVCGEMILMGFDPDKQPMLRARASKMAQPPTIEGAFSTFKVIAAEVVARLSPQEDGAYGGRLQLGQTIRGFEEGAWLRLDGASARLASAKGTGQLYALIDNNLERKVRDVPSPGSAQKVRDMDAFHDQLQREAFPEPEEPRSAGHSLTITSDEDLQPLPECVHRGDEKDGREAWKPLPQWLGASNAPVEETMDQNHWEPMDVLCDALRVTHAAEAPRDRRAKSWARTLAYAQVKLGLQGVPLRRGTPERPFVIWVLGASTSIEVDLAAQAYFADANWVERAPTEVVLFGEGFEEMSLSQDAEASASSSSSRPKRGAHRGNTVKKEDAITWIVEGKDVPVFEDSSTGALQVGKLYQGMSIHGRADEKGWVRLDAASVKLCNDDTYSGPAYVQKRSPKGKAQLTQAVKTASKARVSRPSAEGLAHDPGLDDSVDMGAQEGQPPELNSMPYESLQLLSVSCEPDMVVVFMPAFEGSLPEEGQPGAVPEPAMQALAHVPTVVTTRCAFPPATLRELRRRMRSGHLLLEPTRCPFSAAAGDPSIRYDDNGWILAVQGAGALAHVLSLPITPSYPQKRPERDKVPAVFWGIVDLKYDPRRPIWERLKMLETGDGRTSKFSGDGADIPLRVKDHYQLEEGVVLRKHHFVSADKKLTHDLMEFSGYEHLVPMQACFPRRYTPELERKITTALGVSDGDYVVLKLCNRSRAAGVIVVPVDELEDVLLDILVPPGIREDGSPDPKRSLEAWLDTGLQRLRDGAAFELGIQGPFDEQKRHWWANEHPAFVVERWCTSIPTWKEDLPFDGTMRVAFALRRRKKANAKQADSVDSLNPEDLEVEWLGGYWKLPKTHMQSEDLRERIVSAARTSGTAPVNAAHLHEVYAALGDSIQQLFGGAQPTYEALKGTYYEKNPALAAYLTARLGMSMSDSAQAKLHLDRVRPLVDRPGGGILMKDCVLSFLKRCQGVLHAKEADTNFADRWNQSLDELRDSLRRMPCNANALYLLGMAALDQGRIEEARDYLNKSLLLDPDHRATYVNLGVAYLRLGSYDSAVEISEAGLARFPQSPQSHYHIGVACCQLALELDFIEFQGGTLTEEQDADYEELRERAQSSLAHARESSEAEKRKPQPGKNRIHPWTAVDQDMVDAMSSPTKPGKRIELPPTIGWRFYAWRV